MRPICAIVIAIIFGANSLTALSDEKLNTCFYLDRYKMNGELVPIVLKRIDDNEDNAFLKLDSNGLYHEDGEVCPWSLNGGSGEKERFSLDGNFAIPILKPECESPFSHQYTGIGFGDWYLTLCGICSSSHLYVDAHGHIYSLPVKALKQWSQYEPGNFPVKGDQGD